MHIQPEFGIIILYCFFGLFLFVLSVIQE